MLKNKVFGQSRGDRLEYIDIMKGIGIILMVLGHMHYNAIVEKLIYGFHMPLFFWLSGYLYHTPKNYCGYVKRKARTLLVPYFTMGIFYIMIVWLMDGYGALWSGIRGVFITTTNNLPIESALWFLLALFWVCCLYCIIDNAIKVKWKKVFLLICITIVGCKWTQYFHFLPWGINSAMSAIGFFAFGNWFRIDGEEIILKYFDNHKVALMGKNIMFVVLSVVIGSFIMINDKVNMRVGNFGFVLLSYFSAICCCILLFVLAKLLENNFIEKKHLSVLLYIGRNSIIYVCVNHLALNIAKKILISGRFVPGTAVEIIFEFVIAMGLMATITETIKKTPINYVFFRGSKR